MHARVYGEAGAVFPKQSAAGDTADEQAQQSIFCGFSEGESKKGLRDGGISRSGDIVIADFHRKLDGASQSQLLLPITEPLQRHFTDLQHLYVRFRRRMQQVVSGQTVRGPRPRSAPMLASSWGLLGR